MNTTDGKIDLEPLHLGLDDEIDRVNPYRSLVEKVADFVVVNTAGRPSEVDINSVRELTKEWSRVVCELGSGSGRHLITLAERDRDTLYIGVELRYKRAYRTVEKAIHLGLKNLRVFRSDARYLPILFQESSLDGVYINFPDPWDKRRWLKNRLVQPSYVADLGRLLRSKGFLSYKTDHEDYFKSAIEVIRREPQFVEKRITHDLLSSPWCEESVATEFELLFRAKGLPIFYTLFERGLR
jgi:tRNA (guanine-N7-)-methyltransferase